MSLNCIRKIAVLHNPIKNEVIKRLFCEVVPNVLCKPSLNPQNLPLLPIPKLNHTLFKLLKSAEPFVTHCELITARDICHKFLKNEGYEIQQLLIQRAKERNNWLEEWYMKCSYLCNREPLPMNTSSVFVFPTEKFNTRCDQLNYVAKMILGVLKFRKMTQEDRLTLETWGRYPLDMGVYKRLFSYTRTPQLLCDQLVKQKDSEHIVVVYNNNFFKVTVMNDESQPLSFLQLLSRLEDVVECGYARGEPFGILTAINRDRWCEVKSHMKLLPENEVYLDDIDKALFLVCLDNRSQMSIYTDEDRKLNSCLNGFHGHGPELNAANRWYDKTLQFFVNSDGSAGLIFEHSPVTALPLGKLVDFLVDYVRSNECLEIPFLQLCEKPQMLSFVNTDDTKIAMQEGYCLAKDKSITFSCQVGQYDKYGREFCKENDVGSDAMVQIAIQLAHYRAHGHIVPQQEIASTRKYYLGRSDLVRSCTCEMVRFIKSVDDPLLFLLDRYDYLKEAVRVHRALSEDAMDGRAIDCHLFGLMMASREAGRHLPKVFQSRGYLKSSKFKILSLQVPMKSNSFICYPPSSNGGYGVAYNVRKDDFNICVTCKREDCETNSKKLKDFWCCSMKTLSDVLCGFKKRRNKLKD